MTDISSKHSRRKFCPKMLFASPFNRSVDFMTDCIDLSRGPLRRGVAYALAVVLFSYIPSATQTRKMLDFTQRSVSAFNDPIGMGATLGEVEGVPSHYALPLELTIQSVSPIFVGPQRSFLVEVLLKNTGSTSYLVPASLSAERESLRGGNRGRRTLVLQIAFLSSGTQLVRAAGSSNGSDSYPNSLVELKS